MCYTNKTSYKSNNIKKIDVVIYLGLAINTHLFAIVNKKKRINFKFGDNMKRTLSPTPSLIPINLLFETKNFQKLKNLKEN